MSETITSWACVVCGTVHPIEHEGCIYIDDVEREVYMACCSCEGRFKEWLKNRKR